MFSLLRIAVRIRYTAFSYLVKETENDNVPNLEQEIVQLFQIAHNHEDVSDTKNIGWMFKCFAIVNRASLLEEYAAFEYVESICRSLMINDVYS